MKRYYAASNTKFNNAKVQAFSVSGRDTWETWEGSLTQIHIKHLHSVENDDPLIYLGFPLVQSHIQRINFMGICLLGQLLSTFPYPFTHFSLYFTTNHVYLFPPSV